MSGDHYPIKRRLRRGWMCACGRPLARCTAYFAALANPR